MAITNPLQIYVTADVFHLVDGMLAIYCVFCRVHGLSDIKIWQKERQIKHMIGLEA